MKQKNQSRLQRVEGKRNRRRVFLLTVASIAIVGFTARYAFDLLPRFTDVLRDFSGQGQAPISTDNTAPPTPDLDNLPTYTNERNILVSGHAEPGSTVIIYFNDSKKDLIVNANGSFSTKFDLDGSEGIVYAMAEDSAGNQSAKSQEQKITFDNEAPEVEIITPKEGQSFYGTSQKKVVIEGTTEPGSRLTINERVVIVTRSGKFKHTVNLSEGENILNFKITDQAGNEAVTELKLNYSL